MPPADADASGAVAMRRLAVFVRVFARSAPSAQLVAAGALVLAAALTEGVGLALLVPTVALLDGSASRTGGLAGRFLAALGTSLSVTAVVAACVVVVALRAVVMGARDFRLARLRAEFVDHLRRTLFRAVAQAEWQFLARERLSAIAKALTQDVERIGVGVQFSLRIPALLAVALMQLAIALRLAPALTLAAMAATAGILVVLRGRLGFAYGMGAEIARANRAAFAEIAALLDGLKLAKSHHLEPRHIAAFEEAAARQRDGSVAFAARAAWTRTYLQIFAAVALGLYIVAAVGLAHLSTASLAVTVVIFVRLLPLLTELQQASQTVLHMLPAFDDWHGLAERAERAAEASDGADGARVPLVRELRASGLRFRYDKDRDRDALADIDVVMPAGSVTAIVGASGAGKTTLVDLLAGLLVPDAGEILIDGTPLGRAGPAAWRRSIGYVPQENFLLNDTVRANLLWAAPEADEGALTACLAMAAADGFVARLAHGLDTPLGERGTSLSGGERQRLALARALLRRPTLLILDEATSALDDATEAAIGLALERLRGLATILVIAHRPATVRRADHVIVLADGRVAQAGRWDELRPAAGSDSGEAGGTVLRELLA